MTKPLILMINASPRRENSTSFKLLLEIKRGIEEAGGETKIIHLIDIPILPCMGHYSDSEEECNMNNCTKGELEDGVKGLFQTLLSSDGLVIVTPVYWFSLPGHLKNFIDRLTSLENRQKLLDGKVAGIGVVAKEEGAISTIMLLLAILNDMGFLIPPHSVLYHNSSVPIEEDISTKKQARNLGINLVRLSKLTNSQNWFDP